MNYRFKSVRQIDDEGNNNYDFYKWCSGYLDYQHIKNPELEKMKGEG